MKINKTNLAFGTLLCAATLSSMLMTHSNIVHADVEDANTQQGAAAMQFDRDVQDSENNDVQTRQVSQTKNMTNQSAQPQNAGAVERERDSRLISTVHSVSQNEDNQGNILVSNTRNSRVNVHYVDLNGNSIKDDNVEDDELHINNYEYGTKYYPIPNGYLIGDGAETRKQDFKVTAKSVVDVGTVSGGVKYHEINDNNQMFGINDIDHSNLELNQEMSNRLYNAINADPKSKILLFDWDKVNNYIDFTNYLYSGPSDYDLTLGFPTTIEGKGYNSKYTDLANRKPENLCVVGWKDYSGADLEKRFTDEKFRINIGKRDPELAKYIYNTVMNTVDNNIVNGSIDIGHDKLENADGTLHITLNSDGSRSYHTEYTLSDLTGLAKADKNKVNTIDVPIIKRDKTVQDQIKKVTRTIQMKFPDNKVPYSYRELCDENGVIEQNVYFLKKPLVDTITGKTVEGEFSNWTPVVSTGYYGENAWRKDTSKYAGQFPPITFPRIPGFTLHINRA